MSWLLSISNNIDNILFSFILSPPPPPPGSIRNLAFNKEVTDELCLFFTEMTYVPGHFFPYIFWGALSHKRLFSKMAAKKGCGYDKL